MEVDAGAEHHRALYTTNAGHRGYVLGRYHLFKI